VGGRQTVELDMEEGATKVIASITVHSRYIHSILSALADSRSLYCVIGHIQRPINRFEFFPSSSSVRQSLTISAPKLCLVCDAHHMNRGQEMEDKSFFRALFLRSSEPKIVYTGRESTDPASSN
jgi:hypothetical protein